MVFPMNQSLKKLVGALFASALVLGLAACGTSAPASSEAGAETTAAAETSAAAGGEETAASSEQAAAGEIKGDDKLEGTITASGASALKPLADRANEDFMKLYPNVLVTINAGGSGTGLNDIANKAVTLGMSDVFATEKLTAEQAKPLVDHQVAIVTMGPIVNEKNKVEDLTTQQLQDIFSGKVKNWKEVGGDDMPITLITRPESSGTRATFKKWALDGVDEVKGAIENDNSGELVDTVKQTPGAIGYVALSYMLGDAGKGAKYVKVNGVEPSLENTYNGTYPVWTFEHIYTNGEPQPAEKAFLDYMMSEQFAPAVEEMGYGAAAKLAPGAADGHDKAPEASK